MRRSASSRYLLGWALWVALLAKLNAMPAWAWQVVAGNVDLTAAAVPLTRGNELAVNVTSLAPALGLNVQRTGIGEFSIVDYQGNSWRGSVRGIALEGPGRVLRLAFPAQVMGNAVYLPLDTVAALAGLAVEIDPQGRKASLRSPVPVRETVAPDGWEPIAIEKPAEARQALAREREQQLTGSFRPEDMRLPKDHEVLRLGLGVGVVHGTNLGIGVSANGRAREYQIGAHTFVARGERGAELLHTRIGLWNTETLRGVEIGDLASELWGSRPGIRFFLRRANGTQPAVTVFARQGGSGASVSYRDEVRMGNHWTVGGELAHEGSYLFRAGYQANGFGVVGFARGGVPRSAGLFVGLPLWGGASLSAGLSKSGGEQPATQQSVVLRVPLFADVDFYLERFDIQLAGQRSMSHAAMFSIPLGFTRVMTRFQAYTTHWQPSALGLDRRSVQSSASWTTSVGFMPSPRLSLDYQLSMGWRGGGRQLADDHMAVSYRVAHTTEVRAFGSLSDFSDPERLRLSLEHRFSDGLALSVDYGQVAPYRSTGRSTPSRGFKVMLRREWDVKTPAGGAVIHGRVVDVAGKPVRGVVVRWDGYATATDASGRYALKHVPPGTNRLVADEASLPADYRVVEGVRQLTVVGRREYEVDFVVVPLRTLTGYVFWDRNGNGQKDPGEGVAGAVLHLNGFVTASAADGSFAFHNLDPGVHTVRLDTERLPTGFAPASAVEMRTELMPDRASAPLLFLLMRKEKPIEFQDVP